MTNEVNSYFMKIKMHRYIWYFKKNNVLLLFINGLCPFFKEVSDHCQGCIYLIKKQWKDKILCNINTIVNYNYYSSEITIF